MVLTKEDLQAIASLIDERVMKIVDERVTKSESFLLDEIERSQKNINNKIEALQNDVNILKSRSDTYSMINDLEVRVSILENKVS